MILKAVAFVCAVLLALAAVHYFARLASGHPSTSAEQRQQPPANAQACGPRAAVLAGLARQYGERPAGQGLTANGMLLELLASASGSWTMLLTRPGGAPCVFATGEGWEGPPPAPGERS